MSEQATESIEPPATTAAADALHRRLAAEPWAFDFFQAVRRLECATPALPRVGTSGRLSQDAVRFAQEPSLAFAASAVTEFEQAAPEGKRTVPRMAVSFMGLWGPGGPMPIHLTEYARDRQRNENDPTLARFADVFHHRILSLFYRAWAVNQPAVAADRLTAADDPDADRFAVYVASLIGRGMPSLRGRDAVPDAAKLHWAGHLAGETTHAEGLAAILSSHFGVPCDVQPFAGQWIDLPPESWCKLGKSRETGELGRTSMVGSRVWDCQGKFRVRIGPVSPASFARLVPGEPGNRELRDWIRNYAGDQLAWEAKIVLASRDVPGARLGQTGRLGWSAWLPTTKPRRDVDDLVLHS